jgi:hypothetical protein
LRNTIADLEKNVQVLRGELRGRDDAVGEKERRVFDLKKKTQELEKFKFVLEYKIKELKKEIEPRERDVVDMKSTIKKMDHELERYHESNVRLDLTVRDLRGKLEGVQRDVAKLRTAVAEKDSRIRTFQADLYATSRFVQHPKKLARSVTDMYQKHVAMTDASELSENMDEDLQKEFARQRLFLEKTIENLKKKLTKDAEAHRADTARVLNENVALLKEVNELRREAKQLRKRAERPFFVPNVAGRKGVTDTPARGADGARAAGAAGAAAGEPSDIDLSADAAREIERLRVEIAEARLDIQIRDARVRALERDAGRAAAGPDSSLDLELEAAVKIQASARGRAARKEVSEMRRREEERKAAIKIQAARRGHVARREVEAMREEAEADEPPPLDKEDSLGAV